MDDSDKKSKAAKKNEKRKAKKKAEAGKSAKSSSTPSHAETLESLKEQLELAKANKDHALAGILRNQVWVLGDIVKGVKTDLPDNELRDILATLPSNQPAAAAAVKTGPVVCIEEKKLRALKKKMEQIAHIKEKQEKGLSVEPSQLEKVGREQEYQDEIDQLCRILSGASV